MPDLDAIAIALAARFDAASPGMAPPTGYDAIKLATADLPGQITPLPTVLVFFDRGEMRTGSGTRQAGFDFPVRFYYNQSGDLERDQIALRRWATILWDRLKGATQLGGIVTSARIMAVQIGELDYAGQTYSGLELTAHVVTDEGWAATS